MKDVDENSLIMVMHGAIIGAVFYAIMLFGFKQSNNVAMTRSTLIGLLSSIYMIMFGHKFPPADINKYLL
jgi:hypothetical protein